VIILALLFMAQEAVSRLLGYPMDRGPACARPPPKVLRGGKGLLRGPTEANPCRPGGSGVRLCHSGRGDGLDSDPPLFPREGRGFGGRAQMDRRFYRAVSDSSCTVGRS